MAKSTQQLLEFKQFVIDNLNYPNLSKMNFDEYKLFFYNFFDKMNHFRNNGLTFEDIENFIREHDSNIMSEANDADVMFERRFSVITEELLLFCADPFFWYTDYDIYMKKWEKAFESYWFRII
ncbi:MAG: hypothetical protein IE909_09090 [Campylobacterales bacterium]|nr:hypothetical protein [Campylobacterales bacterium]